MPGRRGTASHSHYSALNLHLKATFDLRLRAQPLTNRLANIGQRSLAARSLRAAPRQVVAPHRDAFSRFHQRNVVVHSRKLIGTSCIGKSNQPL
jgi:hypothetical protein